MITPVRMQETTAELNMKAANPLKEEVIVDNLIEDIREDTGVKYTLAENEIVAEIKPEDILPEL